MPASRPLMPLRTLQPGQRTQIFVVDPDQQEPRLVYETDLLLEAPNWAPGGDALLLNGEGVLWRRAGISEHPL